MRLEPLPDGGFVIDAADLGPLLGVDPPRVPALMREGAIVRRFERGEGADAGRFRLTFLHGPITVRLIVGADGSVLSRARIRSAP